MLKLTDECLLIPENEAATFRNLWGCCNRLLSPPLWQGRRLGLWIGGAKILQEPEPWIVSYVPDRTRVKVIHPHEQERTRTHTHTNTPTRSHGHAHTQNTKLHDDKSDR